MSITSNTVSIKRLGERNSFRNLFSLGSKKEFLRTSLVLACLFVCSTFAQGQSEGNVRYTQGDVSESATLSLGVPLGRYKGRGLDLPISLSYSSNIWRLEDLGKVHDASGVHSITQALYAEHSVAGWKSTLDLPKIEFQKRTDAYDWQARPHPSDTWNGCFGWRIARLFIHMPNGSTHEFRESDLPRNTNNIDMVGTFYAVDGSRMRYDSTGEDTGTLYLPDGTRYVLGHPTSSIIDRNGNTQTFSETTRQWTDTLGRVIANPLPSSTPNQAQEYTLNLPGLNGTMLPYTFRWLHLSGSLTPNADGTTPTLRYMASHYLPQPSMPPSDSGNYPVEQSSQFQSLFQSAAPLNLDDVPVLTFVVGDQTFGAAGGLFNPVVLAEIVLPDGTSYKFSYNVYGELEKITYPTTAYEKYEYASSLERDQDQQPYIQAQRRVTSRQLSINGLGNDTLEWKYFESLSFTGNPIAAGRSRVVSIVAPDKTRTEISKFDPQPKSWPLGFNDTQQGLVFQRKFYSTSLDGLGGQLLRREITQYEQKANTFQFTGTCGQSPFSKTINAFRNPRPVKTVNITFEGNGPALAQTNSFDYETIDEMTTGVDQTLATTSHYAVVDNAVAQTGTLAQIPVGSLARSSETTYLNSPGEPNNSLYRDTNILGLATVGKVKDSSGMIVSQAEMIYDENGYSPAIGRALPTSSRVWDSTKGLVTDPNAYLTTHAKFDLFGNLIEATDAKGYIRITEYDATFQAFPVKTTTPIPDPNPLQNPDGQPHGSQTAFESTIAYDFTTGLLLSTTDANGQTTQMEYNDPFLRPTRIIPPAGGVR